MNFDKITSIILEQVDKQSIEAILKERLGEITETYRVLNEEELEIRRLLSQVLGFKSYSAVEDVTTIESFAKANWRKKIIYVLSMMLEPQTAREVCELILTYQPDYSLKKILNSVPSIMNVMVKDGTLLKKKGRSSAFVYQLNEG